jgi:hypothetical protein
VTDTTFAYSADGARIALWASVAFVLAAGALSLLVPRTQPSHAASSSSAPGTT